MNEEHYRKEFRSARLGQNSTFSQFATDLSRKFDAWMLSAEVDKTFDNIRDKMISDQFLASVTPELRVFIREHTATNLSEISNLADRYAEAHPGIVKQFSNANKKQPCNFKPDSDPNIPEKGQNSDNNSQTAQNSADNPGKHEFRCYSCGEMGHRKSNCPKYVVNTVQYLPNLPNSDICGPTYQGTVNGIEVSKILRDTGCSTVVVSSELIQDLDKNNCEYAELSDYIGRKDSWPVVSCNIDCKLFSGRVNAVVAPIKHCAVFWVIYLKF